MVAGFPGALAAGTTAVLRLRLDRPDHLFEFVQGDVFFLCKKRKHAGERTVEIPFQQLFHRSLAVGVFGYHGDIEVRFTGIFRFYKSFFSKYPQQGTGGIVMGFGRG